MDTTMNTVMNTIIYNKFMEDKAVFNNFYKELSKSDKIKMMCNMFIEKNITIEQFKTGLKEISDITLTELFKDKVIKYLYKECDRKNAGDGTRYYVPNENYNKIFTAFLEAYGCDIEYECNYYGDDYGWVKCDIFNKYYHEIFNSIDMLKVYVDYIINDKANHTKNIKTFVRTIYYMIHSLNDDIVKYILEEFEKEKCVRNIFIDSTYKFDFVEKICQRSANVHTFMIKRLFTYTYKVQDSEEFLKTYHYKFTDTTFIKECFRKMKKVSYVQLAELFKLYCIFRSCYINYIKKELFIYLIKASIRSNRHMHVSKQMQKMEKNEYKFLANYFIQLGVLKQHNSRFIII